jgi:Domain of unknown function (DUF397)
MTALNERWHKATRSGANGQCVEARYVAGVVEVRNSNHPTAGTIRFPSTAWEDFVSSIDQDGEFRLI